MKSGRFRIDVLGPLRARTLDGVEVTPGGTLPRKLLSLLVLRRGRTVTADAAIELLWPAGGPTDPVAALHNQIARLRRVFPDLITSVPDGYCLDPHEVDVEADELADALANPTVENTRTVERILDRWRGPAYRDLEDYPDAAPDLAHWEELRTRAREMSAQHRLTRGDTDGLAAHLRALVDQHPLRERPRALLMDVLVATDRHADALRIYDEFRRLLSDELGIDPSPELAAAHRRILDSAGMARWSPESRLLLPPTSLIGRDEMLTELEALTRECRLLTLVGPGGVGKTRLLLELGHRLAVTRPEIPVMLCELARVETATLNEALTAGLRIDQRPGVPLVERIAGVVGPAEVVVLLDNCEHVLEPIAGFVEQLMARCAGVRVVTTSRERLRAAGEHVRPVPPLAVDGPDSAAVRLFLERARAVGVVEGDAATQVAGIVARLDGLPLAIELAAARMYSHDLAEIAAGLEQPFEFLSAGYRTSIRHGSLSAAVAWSFTLLDERRRRVFSELSAFTESFEVAAAAAICELPVTEVAELLTQLVEGSLVMRYPGRRYVLLETLRAFGREQLRAEGRETIVDGRHAHFTVTWVEQANQRLALSGSSAISEIDEHIGELHRALDWLLAHGEPREAGRIVAALSDYGLLRLRPDVLGWADEVLAAAPEDVGQVAAQVWAAAAYAAWMVGDIDESGRRARRSIECADLAADSMPARAFGANGVYELFAGRLHESARWYDRAAEQADSVGDRAYRLIPQGTAIMVRGYAHDPDAPGLAADLIAETGDSTSPYAAYAWYCAGEAILDTDPELARERLEKALHIAELTATTFVTGVAGASKASLDVRAGRYEGAASTYPRLIRHWRRAGMWATQWVMLRSIAHLFEGLGRPEDAALLEGAIRAAPIGQRPSGADGTAMDELAARLRAALGDERYETARQRGAALDSDSLIEYVLGAL
ncbi:BTAD domain-containing putative transcriptional regulator [Nocardia mangyaensis]|uniref:BTAD domain-containing putative transcriptional regulator n=1 Tax=Nocardia mangyaensis TaxID=2213200 RepID=UPI002676F491|nr:BTAD domain-containing putative transcriptional regulator [Nocardia mangyaensis]MDO3646316.1 BTAD domain-containing putative transcriptional regulator [Nocardia mangyaensis]